jgi:ABC-type multidrug transport system ATPase subunit
MIQADGLTARSAPVALAPLSFELGAGVHALVGTYVDGVPLVLAALAGRVRLRKGSLRLLGKPLTEVRASVAYVPLDLALPDALTVNETFALAAEIRGEPRAEAAPRLAALGIASLGPRRVRSLTRAEARAVAMAEALTSSARVILLEEPYMTLDPRAAAVLAVRLRERAKDGACVVIGTASVRDAIDLADDQLVFDRGVLVRTMATGASTATPGAGLVRLSAGVSDIGPVLPELAKEATITAIESDHACIVVSGLDARELAAAVGRAVLRAGVDLEWLRADAPRLEELRAGGGGNAAAAYQAAMQQRARSVPPPGAP